MELHEKISFLRGLKGWSQEDMAEKVGMSLNGYAKIERGETDVQISRLKKIAELFGIELTDLFNFDGNKVLNLALAYENENENNSFNTYMSNEDSKVCRYEIEKLQLIIEHKDKEIGHLKKESERLNDLLLFFKQNHLDKA